VLKFRPGTHNPTGVRAGCATTNYSRQHPKQSRADQIGQFHRFPLFTSEAGSTTDVCAGVGNEKALSRWHEYEAEDPHCGEGVQESPHSALPLLGGVSRAFPRHPAWQGLLGVMTVALFSDAEPAPRSSARAFLQPIEWPAGRENRRVGSSGRKCGSTPVDRLRAPTSDEGP
jgi:hypothetical protein